RDLREAKASARSTRRGRADTPPGAPPSRRPGPRARPRRAAPASLRPTGSVARDRPGLSSASPPGLWPSGFASGPIDLELVQELPEPLHDPRLRRVDRAGRRHPQRDGDLGRCPLDHGNLPERRERPRLELGLHNFETTPHQKLPFGLVLALALVG